MAPTRNKIHKKIDRIMDKLESVPDDDKAIATQTKLLGDLVALAKQDSAALRLKGSINFCGALGAEGSTPAGKQL